MTTTLAALARPIRLAIAGNPNAGKTCIFNALTQQVRSVGNYPGVTVERFEGYARVGEQRLVILDLPGAYSLTPYSAEERIARRVLLEERPDVVVDVVDASNLERNLYLTLQLLEMQVPVVVALNMVDVARRRGQPVDADRLAERLGAPVVETVGRRGIGCGRLLEVCAEVAGREAAGGAPLRYDEVVEAAVARVTDALERAGLPLPASALRWVALRLLEGDEEISQDVRRHAGERGHIEIEEAVGAAARTIEEHFGQPAETVLAEQRYALAAEIARECTQPSRRDRRYWTDRIDAVVCHKVGGPLVLAGVVYALFVGIFKVADEWGWLGGRSPTEWAEWMFAWAAASLEPMAARAPMLHSLLADGVIGGVGAVLSFVPLIFTMFVFIGVLEDSGYIARVAFILDRALRVFGLSGNSIVAMIVSGGLGGGGCAVPGVMATRTLRDPRDRLVTILVAPLMNCGAKMTVYLMLIAAFFAGHRAAVLFTLWAASWVLALSAAWVLRRVVVRGEQAPFVMELPVYHVPSVRNVLRQAWRRTWLYIRRAGTLILALALLLWAAMYFPVVPTPELDAQIAQAREGGAAAAATQRVAALEAERARIRLEGSVAGRVGRLAEPVLRWAGFDWRDNIALIGGFVAKEVIVGTLGVAYAMGPVDPDAPRALSDRLAADPAWSPLRAAAMMVFVMIYAPCMATQVMIRREAGSWRWSALSLAYTTALAFVLAVGVYQIGSLLGLGS